MKNDHVAKVAELVRAGNLDAAKAHHNEVVRRRWNGPRGPLRPEVVAQLRDAKELLDDAERHEARRARLSAGR